MAAVNGTVGCGLICTTTLRRWATSQAFPSAPRKSYSRYIQMRRHDVASARLAMLPKVSFFDYPFIFDAASKSRIMHIDAVVQMSQSMLSRARGRSAGSRLCLLGHRQVRFIVHVYFCVRGCAIGLVIAKRALCMLITPFLRPLQCSRMRSSIARGSFRRRRFSKTRRRASTSREP
jgi:hypothetical protein